MSLRTCSVTVQDPSGIRHTVDVAGETLFEAAAMGLQMLTQDNWVGPIAGGTRVEVQVREAVTSHTVTYTQIERWLNGATSSPNEKVKKENLRRLLAR